MSEKINNKKAIPISLYTHFFSLPKYKYDNMSAIDDQTRNFNVGKQRRMARFTKFNHIKKLNPPTDAVKIKK
jgi:hypothetical protein